jgi:Uma2 family endonuclease
MATAPHRPRTRTIEYPTGDGKPMAETEVHRDNMLDLIQTLKGYFAAEPMICVSGNMLMFYEEGNRRKHVSPDVFVVRGIEKRIRENYLIWAEGKAPDLVIELTSKSTRHEDQVKKRDLYRDVLQVPEYFMFDPTEDYLDPPLQGFRLVDGEYLPIEPVAGRLPSDVLGLHLEQDGRELRLYDPARSSRVLKSAEVIRATEQRADTATKQAEAAAKQAEAAEKRADASDSARREAVAEMERLRQEIESLRGRTGSGQ